MSISRLFARIAEREAELTLQADMLRAEVDQLNARLTDIERDLEHIRITQQTATVLADGLDQDVPSKSEPELPEHPLCPQILAVFHEKQQPLRARDLCETLDLGMLPTNIEGVRSKLKRLVDRGILTETEPGFVTQNLP